jgi:hypothetical protein
LLLAALIAVAGCKMARPPKPTVFEGVYQLFLLSRPTGEAPLPDGWARGEEEFARADEAYRRGEYRQAADGFLAAAAALRVERGRPYWEAAAKCRMWCYRNAAYSFAMVRALDEARPALEAVRASDAECAEELGRLIAHLPLPAAR